jgi:DNA-binding XRE family transcriptional regulator
MTREAAGILGARWDKVPERHRPHYPPDQRFRILRIRSFLGLSQRETAEMFRVSVETIARWETETTTTDVEAPRPLVAPNPPVRRFAEATPAEVYFGRTPAHLSAIPPPRGRAGEGPMDSPFRIEYLDAEQLLPILVRKAA